MRPPAAAAFPGLWAALAGVTVTSWGSILVKLASAPALPVAFYRMAFATLILLPAVLLARRFAAAGPARRGGAGARARPMMILAGSCLALHFATWIASLSHTSIASSVILVSTVPIFGAALSAAFLGERAGAASLAAILAAFCGAALIGSGDYGRGGGRLTGDLLALAGAFFAAAYLLIGRSLREEAPLVAYLVRVYGASAAILLVLCAAARAPLGPYPASTWGWLLVMALGPSVVGHGLLNHAVRHARAYVVNTVALVEPPLATLYAFLIFGERPGAHLYAGGALVALGLLCVLLQERRRLATAL